MKKEIKSESAPGKLPVGVSYSVFDELQAQDAPAPLFPAHARPRLQAAVAKLKTAAALRVQDLEGRK